MSKTISKRQQADNLLRRMPRRFELGDLYSPHDLSPVEMFKYRNRTKRTFDVVDALRLRPRDLYKNFTLIQDFTNSAGQIQPRSVTGLRSVNQRRIAKMIRRAQGMGIYPSIHDHPEALRNRFFAPLARWKSEGNR
ncbi:Ribosomal protein S18 [Ophiocordyceps camponoti-floridani]|uniref:Small ribosomal subunit protein bS18m n=1 Tax=Ophiocordyceps camponoti-floridani TaxID=2030778 RepID=A0A8H4VD76_9HYPO|nr:Ribosomal protein S18 [Ophiocordyceps camponoti-floridani]